MAELKDLNVVDASNNGSAANAGFAEGMAPSDVNDASRALEGMLARWLADNNGTLTTAGSSNAYTLASPNQTISAYYDGLTLLFEANHTNTGAATLNVNSLGAKSIVRPDGNLYAGDITSGGRYMVSYDGNNLQLIGPEKRADATFTPTIDCDTTGDLSVAYTTQDGRYQRNGDLVFVHILVSFTPTFTTATGDIKIGGLSLTADETCILTALVREVAAASGDIFPTGTTYVMGRIVDTETHFELVCNGTNTQTVLEMTNLTSGADYVIRLDGVFII